MLKKRKFPNTIQPNITLQTTRTEAEVWGNYVNLDCTDCNAVKSHVKYCSFARC